MEWLKQFNEAIIYIEENLTGTIDYDKAAKVACASTSYFQRMFSYIVGIPLSVYIRQRKMTKAAFDIQNTKEKIINIAFKYGYTTSASFNRAFQSVHNITPVLARKKGTRLNSYSRINLKIDVTGGEAMRYRIENKEAIKIIGIRKELSKSLEENFNAVPTFWEENIKASNITKISNLSNKEPKGILGVSVYEEEGKSYYYISASTNKPLPEGMFSYEIPASTWVIFENIGPFKESVQNIFRYFIKEWLPFSGYKYAYIPDIEVYPLENNGLKSGALEVWIAIKN